VPKLVESDVFNICERIKQIDPSLYVVLQEGQVKPWIVVEQCADGEHRMVERYERLDAGILEDLQRMLRIPYMERFKAVAAAVDAHNAALLEEKANRRDMERVAWTMRRALRPVMHDGLITSYRPRRRD
jgi:hypothetical protein